MRRFIYKTAVRFPVEWVSGLVWDTHIFWQVNKFADLLLHTAGSKSCCGTRFFSLHEV